MNYVDEQEEEEEDTVMERESGRKKKRWKAMKEIGAKKEQLKRTLFPCSDQPFELF